MAERKFKMPRNSTGLLPELPWHKPTMKCDVCSLEIATTDAVPVTYDPPSDTLSNAGNWCKGCYDHYFNCGEVNP